MNVLGLRSVGSTFLLRSAGDSIAPRWLPEILAIFAKAGYCQVTVKVEREHPRPSALVDNIPHK
jgi:hypothetical protein